jgi:hypothetical protein
MGQLDSRLNEKKYCQRQQALDGRLNEQDKLSAPAGLQTGASMAVASSHGLSTGGVPSGPSPGLSPGPSPGSSWTVARRPSWTVPGPSPGPSPGSSWTVARTVAWRLARRLARRPSWTVARRPSWIDARRHVGDHGRGKSNRKEPCTVLQRFHLFCMTK